MARKRANGRRVSWTKIGLMALTVGGFMQPNASAKSGTAAAPNSSAVTVRYQVAALDPSIAFYTQQLGFKLDQRTGPFAQVSRGNLALILSGPGTSGARVMPDGRKQEPGGWNRIVLYVDDLHATIEKLKAAGVHFRNQIEVGPGGSQILVDDPDGNPIELHEAPKTSR